jgi:hypothetical protein
MAMGLFNGVAVNTITIIKCIAGLSAGSKEKPRKAHFSCPIGIS